MIAGHVHYYIKNMSVNPAVGAKTVYICQGSAENYGASIDYGKAMSDLCQSFLR